MFNICEALFILAVEYEAGDIVESVAASLESALAGAILADLVLQKRILLTEDHVVVTDPTSTGHPILDKALFDIRVTTRPRKLKYWINTLTYRKYIDEIGHHLVENGILTRKKKRLHLVVSADETSDRNVSIKVSLKNRLRGFVLSGGPCEPSEKLELAFLYRSGLTKLVFTLGERKAAYRRVKKLIEDKEGRNILGTPFVEILNAACPSK